MKQPVLKALGTFNQLDVWRPRQVGVGSATSFSLLSQERGAGAGATPGQIAIGYEFPETCRGGVVGGQCQGERVGQQCRRVM